MAISIRWPDASKALAELIVVISKTKFRSVTKRCGASACSKKNYYGGFIIRILFLTFFSVLEKLLENNEHHKAIIGDSGCI